jgi:hypothetical protein
MTEAPQTMEHVLEESRLPRLRRARSWRRVIMGLLAVLVIAGLTSALGVKVKTAGAENEELALRVKYASVTRLGLPTPWEVEVTREGGFAAPVTIATTNSYFEIFDENGFSPQPTKTIIDGDLVVWEFDPPEGDTLTIDFDARIEPAFKGGRTAVTSIRQNGSDVLTVEYRTRVLP